MNYMRVLEDWFVDLNDCYSLHPFLEGSDAGYGGDYVANPYVEGSVNWALFCYGVDVGSEAC